MQKIVGNRAINILLALATICSMFSCRQKKEVAPATAPEVLSSSWMMAGQGAQSLWMKNVSMDGSEYYTFEFPAPGLTKDIINNSLTLVYAKLYGYNQSLYPDSLVYLLPKKVFHSAIGGTMDEWNAIVTEGKITISVKNTSGIYPGDINLANLFRLVVIPKVNTVVTGAKPTGPTLFGQYSEDELRDLSYEEMCKEAGIIK